jgi:hypothetical protein
MHTTAKHVPRAPVWASPPHHGESAQHKYFPPPAPPPLWPTPPGPVSPYTVPRFFESRLAWRWCPEPRESELGRLWSSYRAPPCRLLWLWRPLDQGTFIRNQKRKRQENTNKVIHPGCMYVCLSVWVQIRCFVFVGYAKLYMFVRSYLYLCEAIYLWQKLSIPVYKAIYLYTKLSISTQSYLHLDAKRSVHAVNLGNHLPWVCEYVCIFDWVHVGFFLPFVHSAAEPSTSTALSRLRLQRLAVYVYSAEPSTSAAPLCDCVWHTSECVSMHIHMHAICEEAIFVNMHT